MSINICKLVVDSQERVDNDPLDTTQKIIKRG